MLKIKILYWLWLFSASQALATGQLSTTELRDLQLKMQNATQLSVDFKQEKTSSLRPNNPSKSTGKAVFAKPTKFRWELAKSILIFDGDDLYSLSPKDKVATKFQTTSDRSQEIKEVIDVVLDFDSLLSRYDLAESSKQGSSVKLVLKPKTQTTMSQIEVVVDGAAATIQSVRLTFKNKNVSAFVFSNPDRRPVAATSFSVPVDYKVSQVN